MTADDLPWVYILGSLVLNASVELWFRVAHREAIHETTYMVAQSALVFLTLGAIGVSGVGFSLTPQLAALGVLNGLLGYVTGWSHLYAIGRGPVSVTSALKRLSFVVTGVLAIVFLGEALTLAKGAALALAVLAVLVMAGGARDQRPHPMVLLTIATAGVMAFGHKIGAAAGVSSSAFLMCQSGTAHLVSHVVCLRSGGYRFNPRLVRFAVLTGATIAGAMTLAMVALRQADAVVVVPLLQLGFLLTAPASFLFFGEPMGRRKVIGILLGLGAVLFFGIG